MKTKITIVVITALIFCLKTVFSQAPLKQWDARFGGNQDEEFYMLQQTSDGGYILGGESLSGISGDKSQTCLGDADYWIVKTDANGVKVWDARYGGSGDDELTSLAQTSDGGYILGGTSSSGVGGDKTQASQGGSDYWIVKTNANGEKQWDARFGGSKNEVFKSIQQTSDGGYILGGSSPSGQSGDLSQPSWGFSDYWMVKTDANGVKQWDARFGGSEDDFCTSAQQTADGGYVAGGWSISGISGNKSQPSQGGADYWLVKIGANGAKQWDARFGGSSTDISYALVQTTDGGYILGGNSKSEISGDKTQSSQGNYDYWLVKTDVNGVKQWDARFGTIASEYFHCLTKTADGGCVAGGVTVSGIGGDKTAPGKGASDYWIVKTNANGQKQWDADFGGTYYDIVESIRQTPEGGYILGGWSLSPIGGDKTQASQGGYDYWIVKTLPPPAPAIITGTISPLNYIKGAAVTIPYTVTGVLNNGNVFTAQLSNSSGGFGSPNVIGTLTSAATGTISGTIPASVSNGKGYRIRVISSNPVLIGADNGQDIVIGCITPTGTFASEITDNGSELNWTAVASAISYEVRYKLTGTSTWTTISDSSNSERITGLSPLSTYDWQVRANCSVTPVNNSAWTDTQNFTTLPLRLELTDDAQPFEVSPNPFTSLAVISFSLQKNSPVQISLFDLTGRKLQTLIDENISEGNHDVMLNRGQLSAGFYFMKLSIDGEVMTKKVIVE